MISFGSDNHAATHPDLLNALIDCNQGYAPSYGTDEWSEKAKLEFNKLFNKNVETFFVFNGTGANVTALKSSTQSWNSVLVSDVSHLNVDECGAPETLAQCKLIPIASKDGKIHLNDLKKHLIRRGDQHYSQVKGVSLTQPTELGTCYTIDEIKEITDWAHQNKLFVHIDGARIGNAVTYLKTDFESLFVKTNVDVISFGGTKNGFMMGEAVVFLNTSLAKDFIFIRKQCLQLPSKTRYIASQFKKALEENLWHKISSHSLEMASLLADKLKMIPEVKVSYPVQSNAVFAIMPKQWVKELRKKFFFYIWDEHSFEVRLMTSWQTNPEEINAFIEEINSLKSLKEKSNEIPAGSLP